MTTFRYSLIGTLLVAGLLVGALTVKGGEGNAARVAEGIAGECGVPVTPLRDPVSRQLGLTISPVHRQCGAPEDFSRVACARKRISESHFAEIIDPAPVRCPSNEAAART